MGDPETYLQWFKLPMTASTDHQKRLLDYKDKRIKT